MLRIKNKIAQAKNNKLSHKDNRTLTVTINGHKVKIKQWILSHITVRVDDEEEVYHLINPTINNQYTMHQVLRGLMTDTCINPCSACDKYCVHCRCLKPCGLCDIRTAWEENKPITELHRHNFIISEDNYNALKEKLGL